MELAGIDIGVQARDELFDRAKTGIQQGGIQQPEGIIPCGTEDLAAGNVAEGRGDAAMHRHFPGIQHFGKVAALERRTVGAQMKSRLEGVALHLQ